MKRICGYDLNGWRDAAARNWVMKADGEELEVSSSIALGGLPSVIVGTGDIRHITYVGGAQAALAPHGLGTGWGEVGRAERRIKIRDILTNEDTPVEQLTAAFAGLSASAAFGVASIDDLPLSDEVLQERLLAALRKAKISAPLLVWRPVLSALYAATNGRIESGQTIGVISQSHEGFALQKLRIRRETNLGAEVLAPERRTVGIPVESDWGYNRLAERALQTIRLTGATDRIEHLQWARSLSRLMLGETLSPEVLRQPNGDWELINVKTPLDIGNISVPAAMRQIVGECDLVVFESLAQGVLRDTLVSQLRTALGRSLIDLPPTAVAEGALIAARRLSLRQPVYFDFLPQISTIVQRRRGAENHDLIDVNATVPAGEMFRSPAPASFAIQAGQDKFSVFLRKETADRPRKAEVHIGVKLAQAAPVDLWVEQAPASGRAKILLHSESLGHRFQVDWDHAEELSQTWDELLAEFQRGKPTIPSRLVLPCGIAAWADSNRGDGLQKLVLRFDKSENVDWNALASKLSARPDGQYPVSSDGAFPADLDDSVRAAFDRLTHRAIQHVSQRLKGQTGEDSNHSLRFLTWQFRRSPPEVSAWLLEALDQENRGYRLFKHGASWKLAYQGLGRIAGTRNTEQLLIHKLLSKTIDTWRWQNETAAMSFVLSRSETAPRLLTRKDVDRVAKRVVREFEDSLGTAYTKFQYAPLLLVGLLRWRVVDPYALVVGHDVVADKLAKTVERTLADLQRPVLARQSNKFSRILEQTLDELRGEGTNPDLLLDIFGGAEED
jgi:hypothetical protein